MPKDIIDYKPPLNDRDTKLIPKLGPMSVTAEADNSSTVTASNPDGILGAKLVEWWDASDSSKLTVDGSNNAENWTGSKAGHILTQSMGADKPLWDGSRKITFDGVSEFLANTADVATYQALTVGSIFCKIGIITDTDALPFSMGDTTVNSQRFHMNYYGLVYSEQFWLTIDPAPGSVYRVRATPNYTTGEHTYGVTANGSSTQIYVNGTAQAQDVPLGTDTGSFLSQQSGPSTAINIGKYAQLSTGFAAFDIMQLVVTNAVPTAQEIADLQTFFDSK